MRNRKLFGYVVLSLVMLGLASNLSLPAVQAQAQAQASHAHKPHPTPTPTATLAPTPTATATLAPTATVAPTPTDTATPMPTATAMPTPTSTPTSGWVTVVDDEFTTAGVPSHWSLYDGHYGSGPSNNCAQPSQDQVPGDGYMYLVMSYQQTGPCGAGWYEGGMMISSTYEETQQSITMRWRIIPSADPTIVRSHEIIPMIFPEFTTYDNGEDDLCETGQLTGCTTFLHYGGGSQWSNNYTIDLTQFHTWTFTQANGVLTVTIDGALVFDQNVGTTVLPDIVRRAVLQQECPSSACPDPSYAGETEKIQIDYFILQIPG